MNSIKWTIAICTVPARSEKLKRLMKILLPQVNRAKGQIEVLIFYNNFEHSVGYLRQRMNENAQGEYISHIDDDDLIPKDFCETLLPLMDGVDYIGFQVELLNDRQKMPPVFHSLKYDRWSSDANGYYRGVTHLNPLKLELALKGRYPEKNNGEDKDWCEEIHHYMSHADREFTEHYLDRVMYTYDHWGHEPMTTKDATQGKRPIYKSKYVRYHSESI